MHRRDCLILMVTMLGILCFGRGTALATPPRIGDPPPPLALEQIINGPDVSEVNWDAFAGRIVVLEFWATWCGPCVAAIPHLNELAEHLADEPIVFISISDEDRLQVERFLESRPIHTWIGLDTDRSVIDAFGSRGIPFTVIVGIDGKIAAITYPTQLETRHLRHALAGEPLFELPEHLAAPHSPASQAVANRRLTGVLLVGIDPLYTELGIQPPLFQLTIRRSLYGASEQSVWSRRAYTGIGQSFSALIRYAYDVDKPRMLLNIPIEAPHDSYDVIVQACDAGSSPSSLLQRALQMTFGFKTRKAAVETDVLVLTAPHGPTRGLKDTTNVPGGSQVSYGQSHITLVASRMDSLVRSLETFLQCPVVDQTGLDGKYDCALECDSSDRALKIDAVRDQLGLELASATRPIEMLIIEPADATEP